MSYRENIEENSLKLLQDKLEKLNKKLSMYKKYIEFQDINIELFKDFLRTPNKLVEKYNCKNDSLGKCFDNIPGTRFFYKRNSNCDCELIKCPNFILCKNEIPKQELNDYFNSCYHCSLSYNICNKGKEKLKTYEDYDCLKCNEKKLSIEQPYCEHILCLECFKIAHFKPGNDLCPICLIGKPIIITINYKRYEF
jgi:hypothetical protein